MSKWEDSLKNTHNKCLCESNQGLFVPNRQLSALVALLLFLFFACFITGYFLGKKCMITSISEQIKYDVLNDQLSDDTLKTNFDGDGVESVNDLVSLNDTQHHIGTVSEGVVHTSVNELLSINEACTKIMEQENNTIQYYAQLIGFGTEKAAHQFVQKLAAKNIETMVKKHTSRTAKGKTVYWYQVVTPTHTDRHHLELLVSRLEKEERLKDACISTC